MSQLARPGFHHCSSKISMPAWMPRPPDAAFPR